MPLQFVLIDGDHSEEGLRNDINDLLRYRPTAPLYIVMHDSFNPDCRRGIRGAKWAANPHVHLVELDYVSGRLMPKDEDGSYRQMWCGIALAVLLPEVRTGNLVMHENEPNGYLAAYWASTHPYTRIQAQVRRASGFLKRLPRKLSAR